ncbi:uncharacterized protein LOC117124968 isoform X2 [Anneissia japonica]|uniref:uncharacterized protein LOC117124968 isoform X2 n=1 Tax=Anneissia japonica TaxID=1529436 RepID=UPI0014256654|nr:uncharacterized protein LOC117124968 isoform X2 [Anneissia japonica]
METIVLKSRPNYCLRVFTIISLFAIFQLSDAIHSRRSDNREPAYLFSKVLEALTDAKNEILLSASTSGEASNTCTQPLLKPLHSFNDQRVATEISLQCPRSTQLRDCLSKGTVMKSVEAFWSQDFRTEVIKLCCVVDFCMRNSKDCTSIFPENKIKLLSSQSSSSFTMVFLNKLLCKDEMVMSEECSKMSIVALNLLSAESQIDGISEIFDICNPNMTSDILRLIQIIAGNLTSLEMRQLSSQLNGVGIDTSVTREKVNHVIFNLV